MDIQTIVKNLHPLEVRVVRRYRRGEELTIEKIEAELGFKAGNGNQALSWLGGKGLVSELRREPSVSYELTELGRSWKEKGIPEERLLALVREKGALTLPEIAGALGIENKDIGSAFGSLSKIGLLAMDSAKRVALAAAADVAPSLADPKHPAFRLSVRGAADAAFRIVERETVVYGFAAERDEVAAALEAAGITGDEIGTLTPEMLATGAWKGASFRAYNVEVPPTRLLVGRSNPYAKFLEDVKDKLVSLGFEEFDGSLVETEFWNSDALFMPQFHSAHEDGGETGSRGWNYSFDREFTKRLILRSQGTVLSARQLPTAKIPGKYFGIARCFRYDRVDATHLSDFYQTEGIVLGEEVNLRTLLGFLEMFAIEVAGAKEVKYVPGYFPFTEPSVEVHIKHPVLGWFELGGSGIFRPEVTKALGIDVPVAAWGIGIDRMALMALGLNDLRELFSNDIENVRLRRAKDR